MGGGTPSAWHKNAVYSFNNLQALDIAIIWRVESESITVMFF